jgi:hypothetical protein
VQALLVTKGKRPVYQCGEYSLLIGRMVVRVAVEVEVSVRGFAVNLMAQLAIRFYGKCQYQGREDGRLSPSPW